MQFWVFGEVYQLLEHDRLLVLIEIVFKRVMAFFQKIHPQDNT